MRIILTLKYNTKGGVRVIDRNPKGKEAAAGQIEHCPHCKNEFMPERYGWHIPCPNCGKPLNVFPDPQIFVYIGDGDPIGIGFAGGETFPIALIKLFLRIVMNGLSRSGGTPV